jgi:hypothetical protein
MPGPSNPTITITGTLTDPAGSGSTQLEPTHGDSVTAVDESKAVSFDDLQVGGNVRLTGLGSASLSVAVDNAGGSVPIAVRTYVNTGRSGVGGTLSYEYAVVSPGGQWSGSVSLGGNYSALKFEAA